MIKTAEKKTAIHYNELAHHMEMGAAHEITEVFKRAKENLEQITNTPIADYAAFRKDILQYSIKAIKEAYPSVFALNLPLDKSLQMLGIDLRNIEQSDAKLSTTPFKVKVCNKTGACTPDDNKEDFISYAVTDEQHERLDFANELISNLEKCHNYAPYRGKHNLVMGLVPFIYLDPQLGLVPNHHFVLNGIQ